MGKSTAKIFLLVLLLAIAPHPTYAQTNAYTFTGRRGSVYTATWDADTYDIEIATPDSTFPWDFLSFVGESGAVALNGLANIGTTFVFSDNSSIAGAMPGDILRVKGHDAWVLSHLGKIGLVIGEGASAQRAWLSQGVISAYLLEPASVGYRVTVLGRQATVRLTVLDVGTLDFVTLISVTLDDPSDAQLIFATDLEPAISYTYGVEYHNSPDTQLAYDAAQEAIQGTAQMNGGDELAYWARAGQPVRAYLYASQPLLGWSASNQPLDAYLNAETLDESVASGYNDGRVAIAIQAQYTQYFYIGTTVLADPMRTDPTPQWEALRAARLENLHRLPVMSADALPGLALTSMLANLLNSYLINPQGRVYAADRMFIYTPDSLLPLISYPALIPPDWQDTYRDLLDTFAAQAYPSPPVHGTDMYWWKLDLGGPSPLPDWYGGNISDLPIYLPDDSLYNRRQFSDVHSTTEYLVALRAYYQISGDLAFIQAHESTIDALTLSLQNFDTTYDAEFASDGLLFPHVMMSVADLSTLDGVYPAESAATIYAYEAAADLLDALGRHADAQALRNNYAAPMRAAFDATFWNASAAFYMPYADQRNADGKADGQMYQDKWSNNLLFSLRGDVGATHKAEVLSTYTAPGVFYEPGGHVHWLSTDSEHFMDHGGYGISPAYNNGYIMEGGFFSMLSALAPIGYYQMGNTSAGDQYAAIFLNQWLQMGPYETMMEYNGQIPGRMLESSMYIEGTAMPTWLIASALGMQVQGTQVSFHPQVSGAFTVNNLYISHNGEHAWIDYRRSAQGCETFEIHENSGLQLTSANFITRTWQGGTSGDWNTPANWGGTLPDCNTNVTIPSGAHITLSADAAVQNLNISPGAWLDLGFHSLSVEGTLTNQGTLTQSGVVDAACTNGNGCPLGEISTSDGMSTRYAGVYIHPTGADANMGVVELTIRGHQTCGNSGTLQNSVQRCFEISPANPQPAEITFYYHVNETNANAAPVVWHYLGGGAWEGEQTTARGANGVWHWVQASGIDAYSPFALADAQPTALRLTRLQGNSPAGFSWPIPVLAITGALVLIHLRHKHHKIA